MSGKIISESSEWTFSLLKRYDSELARIAHDVYGLDTYPNQIEVITAEQMMDAYSSVGMPIGYRHWSFGKQFNSRVEQSIQLLRVSLTLVSLNPIFENL